MPPSNFAELVGIFTGLIALIVPLVFAITFIVIVWGVTKAWVISGGDENSVNEGKQIALAGVIALVFMFGIWGILNLLQSSIF